jgi:hypothetical protein
VAIFAYLNDEDVMARMDAVTPGIYQYLRLIEHHRKSGEG